ncbi:glutamate/tyrosine decarboxylase-like PLP-dependent enzyme [Jatrophihabitans sp. GAS493]|uniref:pyridoxal phosphate-dependent decarboxylase family protein n=1 Tax=Jatrophihabitans sp. GAS493 TaxID=1907575 RepID=UPI000BB6E762|nr:aminotransferase class V-fold PLP-dependent enzyme [Jatrophihabitans sp. GAS493]SOD71189.1 glutamate/tyrosine decarboxylase-like PLP-dependent enzyme [Jatrophihabitans sp. GAS493]
MTARPSEYTAALTAAADQAQRWLASVPDRPVPPQRNADELRSAFGESVPDGGSDPASVVNLLAEAADPGLMSMASGRFYGWVIGGTLPAALGADWLVSAWDQNAGMRGASPGVVAAEEAAGRWLLDLLGLPATADVGFVTGATMANFSCLAAARQRVLADAGWDLPLHGLSGSPKVRVIVGAERHASIDIALSYLGLGAPIAVPTDEQGRIQPDALAQLLTGLEPGPTILCLQAGNVHSGSFDDFTETIAVAHEHGAWVHVDGAFGLWAAASGAHRSLVTGYEAADSWATDAHKTLNVPYDCGVCIVADPASLRAALGIQASYLFHDSAGDPLDKVPEMSRRARGVPVWAALQSLGRSGVADLIDRLVANARALAAGIGGLEGVEVLNDVVYTQVCISIGDDERTRAVEQSLLADGATWMSGSRWNGRQIIRISVSNWTTDDEDVTESIAAVRRAITATEPSA